MDGSEIIEVCLATCAGEKESSPVVRAWRQIADRDADESYRLTDDPGRANLILFIDIHLSPDWRLRALLNHDWVHAFREKVLVYDERDHPWCALPGLYCSMPAGHFVPARQRACAYYGAASFADEERAREPDLLFSFLGSRSHPIRRQVLKLSHPRAVVEDTSGFVFYDRSDPVTFDRQKAHFVDTLMRSKFVLCPRGAGTASIRLFETLAAGRVPVIISDDWVEPAGPDWSGCSLRVREADITSVPARIEAAEGSYPEMARAARSAHETWFGQPVILGRLMGQCAELLAQRAPHLPTRRGVRYLELMLRETKYQVRGWAGQALRNMGLR